jgi:hypothetical protein
LSFSGERIRRLLLLLLLGERRGDLLLLLLLLIWMTEEEGRFNNEEDEEEVGRRRELFGLGPEEDGVDWVGLKGSSEGDRSGEEGEGALPIRL